MTAETTDTLAAALARVQANLPRIRKGETAQVRSEKGNYSYTYADLADVSETIMPLLGQHGLSFTCRPTATPDGRFVLAYSLLHVSGEREDGEYPLPTNAPAQQLGSAITYGRRYCLCAVTGAAPDDDDDGAAATQQQATTKSSRGGKSASEKSTRQSDGKPTARMNSRIMAQFSDLDVNRDDRLVYGSAIVGRQLGSFSELTYDEASALINTLERVTASPDPAGELATLRHAPMETTST